MELKEDPKERRQQIDPILDNPNCKLEDVVKLFDGWYKYYDQVSSTQN